jgi:hypothetical protein
VLLEELSSKLDFNAVAMIVVFVSSLPLSVLFEQGFEVLVSFWASAGARVLISCFAFFIWLIGITGISHRGAASAADCQVDSSSRGLFVV